MFNLTEVYEVLEDVIAQKNDPADLIVQYDKVSVVLARCILATEFSSEIENHGTIDITVFLIDWLAKFNHKDPIVSVEQAEEILVVLKRIF